jgi:hypothetical protein
MVLKDPETGRFVKGASGNPGGRPKSELSITALIDSVVSENDWLFIIGVLKKRARRGDVKAIEMLMDRRFGKAIQVNEHTGKDGSAIRIEYVNTPYPAPDVSSSASGDTPEPKEV